MGTNRGKKMARTRAIACFTAIQSSKLGLDKKTQAGDVAGVLAALVVEQADVVAHDIGNMWRFSSRRNVHRACGGWC
jgi:pimeloyl-ACP methyl ester carboxylesterase